MLPRADDTTLFLVFELIDFFIFLFASWIMGRLEGRTVAEYGLPWRKMFGLQFWQGAFFGFASITGLLIAMRAFKVFYFGRFVLHGFDIWRWGVIYGRLLFILVALREEFRSRGYALFTLSMGIGFWPAAVLSAAYFGYSHHGNSGEDWIGLFNAGGFGLLACFLLRRTGNLWMPIGLHMAFDWGERPNPTRSSFECKFVRPAVALGRYSRSRGQCALHFSDSCGVADLCGLATRDQISELPRT